jgi:hypothetical protein
MKPIIASVMALGAITLLTLAAGCASTKSTESTLLAAGFKIITPSTPAQEAKLQTLAADKVTMIQKDGKTYYVFPDKAHKQAYVGGPKQLEAYRSLCADKKAAQEKLEAFRLNDDDAFGWDGWGGWGGMGAAPGWY